MWVKGDTNWGKYRMRKKWTEMKEEERIWFGDCVITIGNRQTTELKWLLRR